MAGLVSLIRGRFGNGGGGWDTIAGFGSLRGGRARLRGEREDEKNVIAREKNVDGGCCVVTRAALRAAPTDWC
jgi:hypothetical protein